MIHSKWCLLSPGAAFLLVSFVAACGSSGGGSGGGGSGGGVCTSSTACVSLGTAGGLKAASGYVILAKTGVDSVPNSDVTGNIGISPDPASSITGFALTMDSTNVFSTSAQVTGKVYAADYTGGTTSTDLTAAVLSMQDAYTAAAGRPAGVGNNLNLEGGTLNGQSLASGTYTWNTPGDVNITGDITLTGTATDVWIFQISGTLTMAAAKNVILAGGAVAKNIFWQVAGTVAIGANAHFEGIILGQTSITFGNQATINGRLLAQTAVNIDQSTVVKP